MENLFFQIIKISLCGIFAIIVSGLKLAMGRFHSNVCKYCPKSIGIFEIGHKDDVKKTCFHARHIKTTEKHKKIVET